MKSEIKFYLTTFLPMLIIVGTCGLVVLGFEFDAFIGSLVGILIAAIFLALILKLLGY